jgi:hypothetical protein
LKLAEWTAHELKNIAWLRNLAMKSISHLGARSVAATFLFAGIGLGIVHAQTDADANYTRMVQELDQRFAAGQQRARIFAMSSPLPIRGVYEGSHYALVDWLGDRPLFYTTFNLGSATTQKSRRVWPGGGAGLNLTGSGVTLGEWDGGSVFNHTALAGRLINGDGSTSVSSHATHVAGTMIGSGAGNANARGMSYQARIRFHDFSNDLAEIGALAAGVNRVPFSNHSYGFIAGWRFFPFQGKNWVWYGGVNNTQDPLFGKYTSNSVSIDNITFQRPNYLPVISAGNDRNDTGPASGESYWVLLSNGNVQESTTPRSKDGGALGFDCMPGGLQTAKNVLTVAAVQKVPSYTGPASVIMSAFSSYGPTDDGRIKPDISAAGVGIFSTTPNNQFGSSDGTSMAAPAVTGGLGQLMQYKNQNFGVNPLNRNSLFKALVINTADEAGTTVGPDYRFGWGLLNVERAARQILQRRYHTYAFQDFVKGATTQSFTIIADSRRPLKATIAWSDPAGALPPATLNDPTRNLRNDLDLRLQRSGGAVQFPWRLNRLNPSAAATKGDNIVDNVETVADGAPNFGTYVLRVSHKGTLVGGSQAYGLVVQGLNPLTAVAASSTSVRGGQVVTLTSRIFDPAFTGGQIVRFTSSHPAIIPVPASGVVVAGQVLLRTNLTTRRPSVATNVTLTARSYNVARSVVVRVSP